MSMFSSGSSDLSCRFQRLKVLQHRKKVGIVINVRKTGQNFPADGRRSIQRKGIDGQAATVQQEFELDPFTNTLFLFCGRRRDRIKGLYWEGDGFILLYKRLERGVYQWPRNEQEAKEITPQQYRWLMEGLKVEQPKAHRPVTGLTAI